MSFRDVPSQELVENTATALKQVPQVKAPEWALFAKTSAHTEKPPVRDDWWVVRAASILRKVALLGPVGVAKLRVKYGGRKNRGYGQERFKIGAGNHIRKILQQLEKAGFVKQDKKDVHKGRVITPQGISFLDTVATGLMKEHNILLPKKPEKKLDDMMPKDTKKPRRKKETAQQVSPDEKPANQETTGTSEKPKKPRTRKPKSKDDTQKTEPTAPIQAEKKEQENA